MTTKTNIYETPTDITSFAGSGRIILCDDYQIPIANGPMTYPSVRHAVLCLKTDNLLLRELVCSTTLPADLKEVEKMLKPSPQWNKAFVIKQLSFFTRLKLEQHPDFKAVLLATKPKMLINGLMKTSKRFDIEEVNNDENVYGKILMSLRDRL